jgi:hypothetical protein
MWLVACALHAGVMPAGGGWRLDDVVAPVAEPGIDDAVRAAVLDALAARGALDAGGTPLVVTVVAADWRPTRRSGDVLLWEAVLTVRFEAAGRAVTRTRTRVVTDVADAAGARAVREEAFAILARQVADEGVAVIAQ